MSTTFDAMKANIARINELLKYVDIHRPYHIKEQTYWDGEKHVTFNAHERNTMHTELIQRLALLRKESIQFEKEAKNN